MLMRCYDVPYEYQMSWDYFDKLWKQVKSEIPFKQLPLLVLDDTKYLPQSSSIMRYIEIIADIEIQDPISSVQADAVL